MMMMMMMIPHGLTFCSVSVLFPSCQWMPFAMHSLPPSIFSLHTVDVWKTSLHSHDAFLFNPENPTLLKIFKSSSPHFALGIKVKNYNYIDWNNNNKERYRSRWLESMFLSLSDSAAPPVTLVLSVCSWMQHSHWTEWTGSLNISSAQGL